MKATAYLEVFDRDTLADLVMNQDALMQKFSLMSLTISDHAVTRKG